MNTHIVLFFTMVKTNGKGMQSLAQSLLYGRTMDSSMLFRNVRGQKS